MSQIHAKTDKLSLVAVPEKDGKMRVTSMSWDDPLVTLPDRARADAYSSLPRTCETSTTRISRPSLWEGPPEKLKVLAGRARGHPPPRERVSASCKRVPLAPGEFACPAKERFHD